MIRGVDGRFSPSAGRPGVWVACPLDPPILICAVTEIFRLNLPPILQLTENPMHVRTTAPLNSNRKQMLGHSRQRVLVWKHRRSLKSE